MNYKEQVIGLWSDMNKQSWNDIHRYFDNDAVINWNNTNERFNVEEFVRANSEYPGDWSIKVERLECIENLVISVVKVHLKNDDVSFHATSFFEFNNGKIKLLNEYWGDDGKSPQWRIDKQIGKPINYI
ncbi:nuclear transport factor 2 family protein (plasmid) [Clostridium estertheticum]|uniref:nuclear transport factor 2 family protein n=1 Tax=Clostridium estertheticum TaxID=238834 RepID=UPI001C7E0068|nr:nuclear transport factor 2 family protein [Clostridium estertheticum]MBX4260396.1 nuclear transport factor 2 family protein [Clostridium estertheticum]WLC73022.1 nuclear transport factor 2 family protein [Clostridium estertheticum]